MTNDKLSRPLGLQLSTTYPFYANEHVRYRLVTELNHSFSGKVLMGVPKSDRDITSFIRVGEVLTPTCFRTYQGVTFSLDGVNFYEKIPSLPSSGAVYVHSLKKSRSGFAPGVYVIHDGNAVGVPGDPDERIVLTTNEIAAWSPVDITVSKDAYEV